MRATATKYCTSDHLGNTRLVLQEGPINFTLLATFEPDYLKIESLQFMDYGEAPHKSDMKTIYTPTKAT
jgi:hypothetical protein